MVDIEELVGMMDIQIDTYHFYLYRPTGSIVSVAEDVLHSVEGGDIEPPYEDFQDWQIEEIKLCEDILFNPEYIRIPTRYQIHEYQIMEDFCYTIENQDLKNEMLYAIKGSGAFRRFKDKIHQHGIHQQWYDYKESRLKEIAIAWCEENDLEYE